MKFFLGLLLLFEHIYFLKKGISGITVFLTSFIIVSIFFYISKKKGNRFQIITLELAAYSLPISSLNILGTSFAVLKLPWFYLFGLGFIISTLLSNKVYLDKNKSFLLYILFSLICLGILIMGLSVDIKDALGDYITLLFFYLMILLASVIHNKFYRYEFESVKSAYVNSCVIASFGIITQFFFAKFFGINIINLSRIIFIGGNRINSQLLYDDISSATISLAVALFIVVLNTERKGIYKIRGFIIILCGMVLSSSRTGFVSFVVTFCIYSLLELGMAKKIRYIIYLIITFILGNQLLLVVRPNAVNLLDDNGRFIGYIEGLELFLHNGKNFFLGAGLGGYQISKMINNPMPHFTLINLLTQTGIIYTSLFVILFMYILVFCKKNNYILEMYSIILGLVGSCFIPELFSSRFFTIIVILPFIKKNACLKSEA